MRRLLILAALLLLGLCAPGLAAPPEPSPYPALVPPAVSVGRPAPVFTLRDGAGKPQPLTRFRGRPVALFFFCGCQWCARCAETWGRWQRGGVLTSGGSAATVVVFSGDAAAAQAFARQAGLDPQQTTLLADPAMTVTQGLYHAEPCPRVFVLDAGGVLRYTNDHPEDAPRTAPALATVSRTLDALRACSPPALAPAIGDGAASASPPPAGSTEAAPQSSAPLLHLPATTLGGTPVDLAAKPGWKVIYFWSAACPCVRACERYSFVPLAERYRGRVSFYAVAAGRFDLDMPAGQRQRSVLAHRLPFPVLLDPRHAVAAALGAQVTPETFLLDPQGRVVFSGMPDDSRRFSGNPKQGVSATYLAHALSQALAGKPVTQPHTENQGCIIAW